MFPNTDNERGMDAVRSLLDPRSSKNSSSECIMGELQLEHQTQVPIPIQQLVIIFIRLLTKREVHNFRNAFILVDIVMTVK